MDHFPDQPTPSEGVLQSVIDLVGGRTSYLSRVARHDDMVREAQAMVESEKQFIQSK